MESWKVEELQHFYTAYNEAEVTVRGAYTAMRESLTQNFFASGMYEASFAEKARFLRECAEGISISGIADGEALMEIAINWTAVSLHSELEDDDWFEASTEHIFQVGAFCQTRSGVDALLWHWFLGVEVCVWPQGILLRLEGDRGHEVERLLNQSIGHNTHPSLGVLLCAPNILDGLGGYFQSDEELEGWFAFGGAFVGRLLFTHALCAGIVRLEDSGALWPHLSVVNGAIASWSYPWPNDHDFTIALMEKMGAPHQDPQAEPGYFESEAWCQRLLAAARGYLESFQQVFCERDARDPANADGWKQLGISLQIFRELIVVYEIGMHEQS